MINFRDQMTNIVRTVLINTDWLMVGSAVLIILAGILTMNSFVEANPFASRQIVWAIISLLAYFVCLFVDFRFLRKTSVIIGLFIASCAILFLLFIFGQVAHGAQSWLNFGLFSFQPSDPVKLVLILLLAKYFTRRHIEIARLRHIIISAFYTVILFSLVLLQPDFGSAVVIFLIWLGMVMVSGLSKKHLVLVLIFGLSAGLFLWFFVFHDYQKQRIISFIDPLADVRGAGYSAYQATIAVGSGKLVGKGIGYGTQSKLKFLPAYQNDFIFAAFAEEWGFIGSIMLFGLFSVLIWRILHNASRGATNFETLFGLGLAIWLISHLVINIGMNIGLLPITGITVPFMSYGGSHLLVEFTALGILSSMTKYSGLNRNSARNEIVGV